MGKTYQSIAIDVSVEDVWVRIKNFHDFSWAEGVITSCEAVGDKTGDQVGAKRLLNGAIHETLLELDSKQHTIRYSIDNGPSPISSAEVSNYIGIVSLKPGADGGETLVEWTSSWQGNENAAEEFCHGVYVAMLNALKSSFSASATG